MAKAPRRSGGSNRGKGPRKARPTKAQPAKAQPVRPAAAKPVRPPAAAPVAKPMPPAAAPIARPAAQPVAKPMGKPAARPVAKAPAKPAAAGKAPRQAREEDVGRSRGRPARGGHGGGGMSLGGKVAMLTGLVCLVSVGLAVFLSGAKKQDPTIEMNSFGYHAASVLAGPGARYYRGGGGGSTGPGGLAGHQKAWKTLFGEKGEDTWKGWVKELTAPIPRDLEGTFPGEDLKKRQKEYAAGEAKLRKASGGGEEGKSSIKKRMGTIWQHMDKAERGRYSVMAAWIVDGGKGGKYLAGNVGPSSINVDTDQWTDEGNGFGYIDGIVNEYPVRVYTASIRGYSPKETMTALVAVYDNGSKSGNNAIGLMMLILGPLLVGFTAFSVANGHTKNIKVLAREIDRLGSSGDPERQLRATGSEATAVARSVERMVSNLEFREKHDGADLDEVVSKEQKVAEEIHGALTSRHPPRLDGYEVETLFKPGFEIGGDHFEYFRIDETHLGIILLDTNVRGIPAALVMASTKAYVRAVAPGQLSPAEVLKRVNRLLAGELPAGRHVTALYVVLNTADGSATLASAGHLPLLVYRHQAGKMAKVNPEGIALGMDKGPVFESSLQEGDIPIGLGDRIVLYTDGALRTQNEEGEEFGEARFYASVAAEAPKNSQAFVNFVGAAIDRFHLEVPQNDDITISTVKRLR